MPPWKPKFEIGDSVWITRPHLWSGSAGEIERVMDQKYYVTIFGTGGAVFHTEVKEEHLEPRNPFE